MIEDSQYSIVVAIPEHILPELKDPPKPFLVKFKSKEEKAVYIAAEAKATKYELQTLASAWSKKERAAAFLAVYKARSAFCDYFLREELAKLKNIGKMIETAGMKSPSDNSPSAA